jgi:hypothetical protein
VNFPFNDNTYITSKSVLRHTHGSNTALLSFSAWNPSLEGMGILHLTLFSGQKNVVVQIDNLMNDCGSPWQNDIWRSYLVEQECCTLLRVLCLLVQPISLPELLPARAYIFQPELSKP